MEPIHPSHRRGCARLSGLLKASSGRRQHASPLVIARRRGRRGNPAPSSYYVPPHRRREAQDLWIAASASPPRNDGVWGMCAGGGDEGRPGMDDANFSHHRAFALLSAVAKSLIKNAALHWGITMTTLTASEARANLYRLIDQTAESHQPIHIAGKRTSAVLLPSEDWKAIQETLHLLSVPGMRESIKQSMAEPLSESAKKVTWEVVFSRHALQDAKKLTSAGLRAKAEDLLAVIAADPFQNPRPYEKLVGNLSGAFSRRINIQHRLVLRGLRQGRNGTRAAHVDPLRVSARANRNPAVACGGGGGGGAGESDD